MDGVNVNKNNIEDLPKGFDSSDAINVDATGPVDSTVRPCRPSLRALAEAEREKQIRYGGLKLPQQPDQSEPK
jgi:hypothetical protein